MQFEVGPAGESAMRLAYAESPHPALTRGLLAIQEQAERRFAGSLIDAVIGYTTLTLFFHPAQLERDRVESWLCEQAENVVPHGSELIEHSTPDVVLPVLYHPSVAPDLEWLADEKGLSIDDWSLHSIPKQFISLTRPASHPGSATSARYPVS